MIYKHQKGDLNKEMDTKEPLSFLSILNQHSSNDNNVFLGTYKYVCGLCTYLCECIYACM